MVELLRWCGVLLLCASLTVAQEPVRPAPLRNAEDTRLRLAGKLLLDARRDGFMPLKEIVYAPARTHFLVLACGYECNDNLGFLFRADGSGKRKFTARGDFILQSSIEWSADGRKVYYYRINSSGAAVPRGAPPEGWIEVDVKTGLKAPARSRRLKTTASYAVFNVRDDDVLNVRAGADTKAQIVGSLPHSAKDVRVTGAAVRAGGNVWAPIQVNGLTGWVNQNYLCESRAQTKPN